MYNWNYFFDQLQIGSGTGNAYFNTDKKNVLKN